MLKTCFSCVNNCTFAATVPELHIIRTAFWSLLTESFSTKDNTPPMPLFDAHLGGLFVSGRMLK